MRELRALLVEAEVIGHPLLVLFEGVEDGERALHELGILACPLGEPERDVGEADVAQRFLRERGSGTVADEFVGEHAGDVVEDEGEVRMLEDGAVLGGNDVAR